MDRTAAPHSSLGRTARGPLHAGSNEAAVPDLFAQVAAFQTTATTTSGAMHAVVCALKIFGHTTRSILSDQTSLLQPQLLIQRLRDNLPGILSFEGRLLGPETQPSHCGAYPWKKETLKEVEKVETRNLVRKRFNSPIS